MKWKESIEYRLNCLGVDVKRIEKAGKVRERGYVRTESQKKLDDALEAVEFVEELEKRDEAKRNVAESETIDLLGAGLTTETAITLDLDDYNQSTLTTDQLPILDLEEKMDLTEGEIQNVPVITQQQQEQAQRVQRVSNMAVRLGMDPNLLKYMEPKTQVPALTEQGFTVVQVIQDETSKSVQQPQQIVMQQPQHPQQIVIQQPQQIVDLTKQPQQIITQQPQQIVTQQPQQILMQTQPTSVQPVVIESGQQLVSPYKELPREYVLAPRSRTTIGAVPENERDYTKYVYCNRCPHKYTTRSELLRHQQNACLKPQKQYICPTCLQDYFNKITLREHYYQEHLKQFLYRCKKCGKGFYFKSKRSIHKSSCPNKEDPDKFVDIVRDEQYEKLFVKRVMMKTVTSDMQPGEPIIQSTPGASPTDQVTLIAVDQTTPITPDQPPEPSLPDVPLTNPPPQINEENKETDNLSTLANVAVQEEKMDS